MGQTDEALDELQMRLHEHSRATPAREFSIWIAATTSTIDPSGDMQSRARGGDDLRTTTTGGQPW